MNRLLELIPDYLQHARTRVDPKPIGKRAAVTYRSRLRQFANWVGDREITPELLNEFREWLQFEAPNKQGGRGQKPRSLKQAFTALGCFFDWLEKHHGLQLADPRKVRRPRVNRNDHGGTHVPTDEEVEALFAAAAALPTWTLNERLYRAQALVSLSLAADCALRRCEILHLDRSDLVTEGDTWTVTVRHGKGEEHRVLELNARCQEHVSHYLEVLNEWCEHQPARRRNPALLPVDRSRRWSEETIHQLRHRLLAAAHLTGKRVRLHDFRSYRITRWLGVNGVNPASVAEMAGHSDVATTLSYSRAVAEEKRRAIAESAGGSAATKCRGVVHRERSRPQRREPGRIRGRGYGGA